LINAPLRYAKEQGSPRKLNVSKEKNDQKLTVLDEILEWSKDRPAWQRDSLRRLMLNGELSDDDVRDLSEICKSTFGLAEQRESDPISKTHVPDNGNGSAKVTLVSIFHHCGVNALAEDQTLRFSSGLTTVYGDNAAGKTGYIRILKSACRARGQENILGNVVNDTAPLTPVVAIKYKVGLEADAQEWAGEGEDGFISRVSVFDTQCAAVYLTEKTDVAFRPFGLDLFDKLVKACKAVRLKLEAEQRHLTPSLLVAVQAQVPEGTAVAKLLSGISSLTAPTTVQALARFSAEDEKRFVFLEKALLDLQTNDSEKLIGQLTLRAGRARMLARHLKNVEMVLLQENVAAVFDARAVGHRKSEEAKRLRAATFPTGVLNGTGSDPWKILWESARRFSQETAYPGLTFPVVENGTQCVLCQQDLNHAAIHRLMQFEAFVASTTERELRVARDKFVLLRRAFVELTTLNEAIDETVKEVRIEHEALAEAITASLVANEKRRATVADALTSDSGLPANCPALVMIAREVDTFADQIEERVETLRSTSTDDTRKLLTAEAQELRARKLLEKNEQLILSEIERKKKVAAYELCLIDTKTQSITQKSTAITRMAVTQKLKQSFLDELVYLNFRHVEVELKEVGGMEGVLYHKLILSRAPGVELPKIVSEGEQRCLSIAAFFAELSTADDPSGIVFDDPVSSLDYKWREGVARRLVKEAKTRQVIVFTHDIVFLLLLKQFSEEMRVDQLDQHVRQLSKGAGVCVEELPWVALPVKKKIGFLKNELQAAEKLFRDGHQAAYEKEAKYLYGLLREAWERALEEVLLSGIVERFRPSIQTQQVNTIADITADDCATLETAMTKCSKWLPGHDQAPAARAEVPSPDILRADINSLESWVAKIRSRRN
jgi:energy-coupling factor transporter ATP-binding protein EcfA2